MKESAKKFKSSCGLRLHDVLKYQTSDSRHSPCNKPQAQAISLESV